MSKANTSPKRSYLIPSKGIYPRRGWKGKGESQGAENRSKLLRSLYTRLRVWIEQREMVENERSEIPKGEEIGFAKFLKND
jgi:hypothetical protein